MRPSPETNPSFAGQLLVAHPNMLDPNFRRSVLFISAHDEEEGAMGVIINRPLDKHVSDLVTEQPPEALADVPVFLGGPVGRNQLMFAAFDWQGLDSLRLNQEIALDARPRRRSALLSATPAGARPTGKGDGAECVDLAETQRAALTPERLPKLWFEIMRGSGLGTRCSPPRRTILL